MRCTARARRDADRRFSTAGVKFGGASPWVLSSPVKRPTTEGDEGVRRIMAVRRLEGRRGRPLDVLVEWEGEDSDGDLGEEFWVSVAFLSKDLREEARQLANRSYLVQGQRQQRRLKVGEPHGGKPLGRDRREKGTHNNGGHGYEIGRERECTTYPAALEPQTGAD